MKAARTIVIFAGILAFATVPAVGHTYVFNKANDIWGYEENWDSETGESYPQYGDTAIIPSGKTCRVEADQEALEIEVPGTLVIIARLRIGSTAQDTESSVNGELRFEGDVPEARPTLEIVFTFPYEVTIGGTGTITASDGDACHQGWIDTYCPPGI